MTDEPKPPTEEEMDGIDRLAVIHQRTRHETDLEFDPALIRRIVAEVRRLRGEIAEVHTTIPQLLRNDRHQRADKSWVQLAAAEIAGDPSVREGGADRIADVIRGHIEAAARKKPGA